MNSEANNRGHLTAEDARGSAVHAYRTPAAFRRALMDRIKQAAKSSPFTATQLLAHFVYDRFLARVIGGAPDAWVLKGGTSLLSRLPYARHTKDIDLWLRENSDAGQLLTQLASTDLGDYLTYAVVRKGTVIGKGYVTGRRFHIDAALGDKPLYSFTVDIVTGVAMTGIPEPIPSLSRIQMPGLTSMTYPAYPITDHIADKLNGMMSLQDDGRPSSRYRDLVDLVLVAHERRIEAATLRTALVSRFSSEPNTPLPTRVDVPDPQKWETGYSAVAQHVPTLDEKDLASALGLTRAFLEPILNGRTDGYWEPHTLRWKSDS